MFCVYCGQSLPADALFCNQCGQRLPFAAGSLNTSATRALSNVNEPVVLMTCEIGWTRKAYGATARITFHAQATLLEDKRIIVSSESLPDNMHWKGSSGTPRKTYQAGTAVTQIIDQLLRDGWQLVEEGRDYWWNYKFIRPIRP